MDGRPDLLVLELTRVLDAPPERVFTALTDPAELVEWFGPAGFTMPEIELDLGVGGRYRFGMQPPEGNLFHLAGEFLVLEPPHRLDYTFRYEEPDPDDRETIVRLTLAASGAGTEVSMSQGDFATEARLGLHRVGWTDSFDRLQDFLVRVG